MSQHPVRQPQVADTDWITFPGGELEGKRPKALCRACREQPTRARRAPAFDSAQAAPSASRGALCFQCYRAELDRERALKAAGQLHTASDERFQSLLPFEPIDRGRLERLRAERASERLALQGGAGRYVDKRRRAQIAARHALQQIAAGLEARDLASAIHAAELQLPDAWLPFVVSR